MTLREIAQKIPSEYRKEILDLNMIQKAQSVSSDTSMFYLFTIWKNYVENEDTLNIECGYCLERVLNNFRQLQPILIDLEKQSRLLDSL